MKKCTRCLKELPFTDFHKNIRTNTGYSCSCKKCSKEQVKNSRNIEKHRNNVRSNTLKRRKLLRDHVINYLNIHPCIDCGESNLVVLEFDHVRGIKIESISKMITKGHSIESISNEIEKCEVRCANCHRIITAKRNKNHWSNQIITAAGIEPATGD